MTDARPSRPQGGLFYLWGLFLRRPMQERTQQTPAWPGAREQAEPQHARMQTADEATPADMEKTPPSESGYQRGDIHKRHH